MKVYIQRHDHGAGKWIYNGYYNAWKALGYEVYFVDSPHEIDMSSMYYLMIVDSQVVKYRHAVASSEKTFLFVQPNEFPDPWGRHPNFQCGVSDDHITEINETKNICLWTFLEPKRRYFTRWDRILHQPLAFDSVAYKDLYINYIYDVCFIGGVANNGFNEKLPIMKSILDFLERKTDLNCGFFVNKNLTHEQENKILCNSRVCLNIHDAYQRILQLDTNERTFKIMGLNGVMVSDVNNCYGDFFDDSSLNMIKTSNEPEEMYNYIKEFISRDLTEERALVREYTRNSNSYISRVEYFLQYIN